MKTDALTVAAILFVVGLVLSSLGGLELFSSKQEAPAPLHQGVAKR